MRKLSLSCVALVLVLSLCVLPITASANSGSCGDDLNWFYADGVLTISGSGRMYDFTEGAAPWESYRDEIGYVDLPDSLTYIGSYAFTDYDTVSAVYFGGSLEEIGTAAFRDCDSLTDLYLPETFRIFGESCFQNCYSLRTISTAGGFPSFRWACLSGTSITLYYPEWSSWDVADIADLEDKEIREDEANP